MQKRKWMHAKRAALPSALIIVLSACSPESSGHAAPIPAEFGTGDPETDPFEPIAELPAPDPSIDPSPWPSASPSASPSPAPVQAYSHPSVIEREVLLATDELADRVSCADGTIRVMKRSGSKETCPSDGALLGRGFHQVFLPLLDSCLREALPAGTVAQGEPIRVFHMGTYSNRPISGTSKLSLHAAARAMDIGGIRAGARFYDHDDDFAGRSSSPNWREFWQPLAACISRAKAKAGISIITGDTRPGDHYNHIHVGHPFTKAEIAERAVRGGFGKGSVAESFPE
jgi:hypothetical protein